VSRAGAVPVDGRVFSTSQVLATVYPCCLISLTAEQRLSTGWYDGLDPHAPFLALPLARIHERPPRGPA
jgi:hypothetical protein